MPVASVSLGDISLNVYDAGSGLVTLLIHGFPLDHTMWQEQLGPLAARGRVIAPDLRGFGHSGVTEGTVTMEQHADDLAILLDRLDVHEPITLCGLSMGGYVAWQFLRKYPERVRRLVQCDTRAIADTPEVAAMREKQAAEVMIRGAEVVAEAMHPKLFGAASRQRHPDRVEATRQVMLRADPRGIAAALRGMKVRPDVTSMLPSLRCPTLVVVGETDPISPPDEMRKIAEAIPGAELFIVPEAGHMSPLENPVVVNAAIERWRER